MVALRLAMAGLVCLGPLGTQTATAQSCRAQEIVANQCTWLALDELGGSKSAARRAETLATSTLINGCSPGEYQMILLRGTGVTQAVMTQLRARGSRDVRTVRAACAAASARVTP
jgi:hypothetical protein